MGKAKRYTLNAKQIHVLKLLYKFRFITASLLAEYKSISRVSSNQSLQVLLDQEYIGRYYENDFRIERKGPRYYLAPKALRFLKDAQDINEQALHSMYKNKTVSSGFIDHNLDVLKAYLSIRDDSFDIFTKSELGIFDYFPEPKPDLYINRIDPLDDTPNEYLLDIFTDTQTFVIKKRIKLYIEHYDSGEWEAESETDYPAILVVCPSARVEKQIQEHAATILDNAGIDELQIYTTTIKALLGARGSEVSIWSSVYEPERLLHL